MCFTAPPAPDVNEVDDIHGIRDRMRMFYAEECAAMVPLGGVRGAIDASLFIRRIVDTVTAMGGLLDDLEVDADPVVSTDDGFMIKTYTKGDDMWLVPVIGGETVGGRFDEDMFFNFTWCVPEFFQGFQIDDLREYFNTDDKKRMAIDRRLDAENRYYRETGDIERANFEVFVGGGMKGLAELLARYSGTDPVALVDVDGVFPVKTFDVLGETWTVPVICDGTVFDKQAVTHIIRCMPRLMFADDATALLAQYPS